MRSNEFATAMSGQLRRINFRKFTVSRWHEKQLARLSSAMSNRTPAAVVARGGATALVIFITSAGLTYLSQIVIARIIGAVSYGHYAYVLAWMTLLAYVSALGFDVALLRFVSTYRAQCKWGLLHAVVRYAEQRVFSASAILILTGVSIVVIWRNDIPPELRDTFLIGFPLIAVLAMLSVRCAVLRANDLVIVPLVSTLIVRDGVLTGLVIFAGIGLGWQLDARFAMSAMLIGASLGLLIASLKKQHLPLRPESGAAAAEDTLSWRRAALPLLIIGAVEVLMNRAGVLYLGWMGQTTNAGIYSLAFNIAFLVSIPKTALNTLFSPTISSLFHRKEHTQLQELFTKSTIWSFGAAALIAAGLLVMAEVLFAWFGGNFAAGVPVLRILVIGQVLIACAGSQLPILTMTGHERSAVRLILMGAAIIVAATAILTPWFGMAGAALATVGSMLIWNIAMAVFIWRRLRLLPGVVAVFARPGLFKALLR